MIRRTIACTIALLLASVAFPTVALAQQSDLGQIRIVVTDVSSKAPLELARVLLTGPVITSELTGHNGEVLFTDVPDGIYRARVIKNGYEAVTSPQFEIIEGRSILVNVALSYVAGLKVIGTVTVHSTTSVSADTLSQDSAQRKLSSDLADALNKLSGVSVSTSSDDSDATQTVSLEGHDASQTQLTLDGIPLNAPGTTGNLAGFATDLFSGASVHLGAQLGSLGGSVNFTTLEPTLSWQTYTSLTLASYDRYNYQFAETGSDGKFGIAAEITDRNAPSLVDGETYLDASGLDYPHFGDNSIGGTLLKLHYALSDSQTLTGTFMDSVRDTGLICLRIDGTLPCGYGPNNYTQSNTSLYTLTDNMLLGETTVQASVYSDGSKSFFNELNRYVAGVPSPIGYDSNSVTNGYFVSAMLPARERHTISIQVNGTSTSMTTTPLVVEAEPYYTGAAQSSYATLQATDTIHSNDKLSLAESIGLVHSTYAATSIFASGGATWSPNRRDSYNLSYSYSGSGPGGLRETILSDPASLRFDCDAGVAYGSAPGASPQANQSNSVRVVYTHTLSGGNVQLQVYRQVQNNAVLPINVNGTVLNQYGLLPPGYAALVQPIWDSTAGCNEPPGTPFGLQQLYFSTPIAGISHVYQGAEVTGYLTIGDLVVQPYFDLNGSTIFTNSPFVVNPYSTIIPGKQMINVPLQKAGLTLDYKAPRSAVEYLFTAQYVGINNSNNLPSYTTLYGGVSTQLEHGTLTAVVSNISNIYGGIFASPLNNVPYTTLAGVLQPTIARPLQPRMYQVTYTVKFGQGALSPTGPAFNLPSAEEGGGPGGRGGAQGRGGFFAGNANGPGGQRSFFSPLPTSPPTAPFALSNNSQTCNSTDVTYARQLSSALQAFVASIEAAKTAAGYPASMTPPVLPDATVTYHGLGATYALTITPKAMTRIRPVVGCLSVHIARADDVTSRQLYAPSNTLFFVPQLYFMPSVGLYFVARPPQEGQETFRVYQLPTTPPSNPFEVREGGACTGDVRNTAAQLLTQLRAYFASGAKPPSWTITSHIAKSGPWYELDPGDPSAIGALLVCGRVATGTTADVTARGYDGKPVPELNYSSALGIYIIRPQFNGAGRGQGNGSFQNGASPSPSASPGAVPLPSSSPLPAAPPSPAPSPTP